ncbi:DMT family transporter [Candidatus Saccharibacteria bacterium]|jgi:drug/metabolite transporter (DMT)-like permease|nr:DMT family transporter [Candidatus Saccharibacteria bacterium]
MKHRSALHKDANRAVLALVALTAIYGLTAVMARYFSDATSIFEQWYIRFFWAAVIMSLVFRHHLRFQRLKTVSRYELWLAILRGFIALVLGAGLYAWSAQHAKLGIVTVMQVVPTTALLGMWLLGERLNRLKTTCIVLSFIGAVVIISPGADDWSKLGWGAVASLFSGGLFSLSFVLRKKQTGELNNYELAFITTLVGMIGNYILSIAFNHRLLPSLSHFSLGLHWLFVGAGLLSVGMSLLASYGFEHIKATVASVILDLEIVFGVVFGYLFYREALSFRDWMGAVLVLLAAVMMSYLDGRDSKKLNTVSS